jgi:predicted AAA+ superfamily ATPase
MKQAIRQAVLDWNPWITEDFPLELAGVSRDYHLLPYLEVPEIKIIAGARRVGKSTLLYQMIHHLIATKRHKKNILYLNFEDEVLKTYSLTDIVQTHLEYASIDYLFVDEIQNCSDWVSFVRKAHDRHEIAQIWVSGSNSSLIQQEYATLLTGRNLSIHIEPLSFHEFLSFNGVNISTLPTTKKQEVQLHKLFSEFLEQGGFPAVVRRHVLKKELLLKTLFIKILPVDTM